MEKSFDISLKPDYVNRVTRMSNNGTIPTRNIDVIHRLILGENMVGEIINDWKSEDLDRVYWQCNSVIESLKHSFEYKRSKSTWIISALIQRLKMSMDIDPLLVITISGIFTRKVNGS